jgi:hypothetical protein
VDSISPCAWDHHWGIRCPECDPYLKFINKEKGPLSPGVIEKMTNVVGKVDVVAPNKAGYWSLKMNGTFYGTGSKDKPAVNPGDTVEFVEEMNGQWHNVKKGTLKTVSAQTQEAAAPTSKYPGPAVDWDLKDKKIVQQSARNAAIAFINVLAQQNAITYKASAKEKDKLAVIEALLEHYTQEFFNATLNVGNEQSAEPEADDLSGEEV